MARNTCHDEIGSCVHNIEIISEDYVITLKEEEKESLFQPPLMLVFCRLVKFWF